MTANGDAAPPPRDARVVVVGGGPAGLMAAETARAAGAAVELFEAKGSVGRKFLIAGRGGLNLTHSEPRARFVERYGAQAGFVRDWLEVFDGPALRAWARGLGIDTFIGSSGRVFPRDFKAAPLLRRWVHRLRESGVQFHVRQRWLGFGPDGALRFAGPDGERSVPAAATVLALGGASWPQLGSDGAWVPVLAAAGVPIAPLEPSNCGFDVAWSPTFAARHAGAPLKHVVATLRDGAGGDWRRQGECVVTAHGVEGQLVYALSAPLRAAIARDGAATLVLDLAPERGADVLVHALAQPRGSRSRSEHWRRRVHLDPVRIGLLREALEADALDDPERVAATIKALPLRLLAARPIAEAISTAGGVRAEGLTSTLMLRGRPGVFCAGEMLDWDAPTGGYLLTACFASGRCAGAAAAAWAQSATKASPT